MILYIIGNTLPSLEYTLNLSVRIDGDRATLLRDDTEIGSFGFDHHQQLISIVVSTATPTEDELIIRLAASHVAQYMVAPRVATTGVLCKTLYPIPGHTTEKWRSLLDFNALPQEHAGLAVAKLETVLRQVGVQIERSR